jgi:7-carboxy-7-deazaguanine synthase
MAKQGHLPILEEFVSIQGEGLNAGALYYFIRTSGCPLRCNFCDTEYSWKLDRDSYIPVTEIRNKAQRICSDHGIEWVSITGGEPLIHGVGLQQLLAGLQVVGLKTHVETSGRFYDADAHSLCDLWSMDIKTPCTGEVQASDLGKLQYMRPQDQVKCLIYDQGDIEYAWRVHQILNGRCVLVLQPFNSMVRTDYTKNMHANMRDKAAFNMRSSSSINAAAEVLRQDYECVVSSIMKDLRQWTKTTIQPQLHVWLWGNKRGT